MKSSRLLLAVFIAMLLVSLITMAVVTMIHVTSASPATNIYVSQSLITGKVPGDTFPVDINVTDAPSTYGWEVHVTWDPTLLEYFFKQEGEFLKRGGAYVTVINFYPSTYAEANVKGDLLVACVLYGGVPMEEWATGDGWLFRLGFRVKTAAYGSTLINLFDTLLLDHMESGVPAPTAYPNYDSFFYNTSPSHDIRGRARYILLINAPVNVGEVAKINVTVLNEGTVSESVTLNVYANMTLIGTTNLQLPGAPQLWGSFENRSRTYTVNWDTAGFAYGKYNITASVPAVPGETDTADNNFEGQQQLLVYHRSDIYRDEVVDSKDLGLLVQAYGSTSTSRADINKNNKVEVGDVFILGKDYGKSVPV